MGHLAKEQMPVMGRFSFSMMLPCRDYGMTFAYIEATDGSTDRIIPFLRKHGNFLLVIARRETPWRSGFLQILAVFIENWNNCD
jgi:hypothetical protein